MINYICNECGNEGEYDEEDFDYSVDHDIPLECDECGSTNIEFM
jgi:DNA-directed RNA polymerase subunit RPC12/RpoP